MGILSWQHHVGIRAHYLHLTRLLKAFYRARSWLRDLHKCRPPRHRQHACMNNMAASSAVTCYMKPALKVDRPQLLPMTSVIDSHIYQAWCLQQYCHINDVLGECVRTFRLCTPRHRGWQMCPPAEEAMQGLQRKAHRMAFKLKIRLSTVEGCRIPSVLRGGEADCACLSGQRRAAFKQTCLRFSLVRRNCNEQKHSQYTSRPERPRQSHRRCPALVTCPKGRARRPA